ncbi:hypothetical protein [Ascidiimonas aurantiaca]|uniref:hypothetical protein n=1 Tax=Ascidiimonas aurantiaca TaxID=1685432 RepID=UPI003BB80EE3
MQLSKLRVSNLTSGRFFMLGMLLVNAGNYLYNVLLGRWLRPEAFADAALMITFLLVLSFLAMTFQLATAKFTVLFSGTVFARFHRQNVQGTGYRRIIKTRRFYKHYVSLADAFL